MATERPKRRRDLLWALLVLLLGGVGGALWWLQSKPAAPQAWVMSSIGGKATVQRGNRTLSLQPDSGIYVGDILTTQQHATDLRLAGGTLLRLGPLTRLEVNRDPPPTWQLRQGAIRIETNLQSPSLTIGAPFGIARTTAYSVSVLDIGMEDGLFVRVGEMQIARGDEVFELAAGYKMTIDGLVLKIASSDPTTLDEMVFHIRHAAEPNIVATPEAKRLPITLLGDASARLAHHSIAARYPDKPRQPLEPGDTVLTAGGVSHVLVGTWGDLTLDGHTQIELTSAVQNKGSAQAAWTVAHGGMHFHLTTDKQETRELGMRAGTQEAVIAPGYVQANGRFTHQGTQQVVTLRLGRVKVGHIYVEAGSIVTINNGQTDEVRVRPLAAETADVHFHAQTVVHHIGELPAINFHWDVPDGEPLRLLEVARDAGFKDVRFAEQLHRGSLIVDTLNTGRRYYWRIDGGPARSLQLVPQTPASCPACPGPNPVTDDLTHTVIQFEETMPDLDFNWHGIEGAETYLFRLYRNNHFDKPVYVAHATSPSTVTPADQLLPGGYIWRVAGYDDDGRLVRTSQSYELDLQNLDTHILTVISPAPNAVVSTDTLITRGAVRGSRKLTCNGHRVVLGYDGSFAHHVILHPGRNLLVYNVRTAGDVSHVFTRVVVHQGAAPNTGAPRVSED